MPRRVADYPASTGWQTLNEISTAGSYVLALSMLVLLVNIVRSRCACAARPGPIRGAGTRSSGRRARRRPCTTSTRCRPVRSHAPLLDLREEGDVSRPSVVALVWAGLLLLLGVVLWAVFTPAGVALLRAAGRRRRGRRAASPRLPAARRRPWPARRCWRSHRPRRRWRSGSRWRSLGLAVGPWLDLIGVGVALLGLFGLVREGR